MNRSNSISGANSRGCDWICCTIYQCLVSKTPNFFGCQKRKTNFAIYVSRRNVLVAKIVEHDFYLNSVAVEAFVHLGGLDEVTNV